MAPATKRSRHSPVDPNEDAIARAVFAHYMGGQVGSGGYPIFRGRAIQSGEGIGDIFRNIGRFLFPLLAPVAKSAASKFITSAAAGLEQGKSLKEAAKLGASSGLGEGAAELGFQIQKRRDASKQAEEEKPAQAGAGRRRKRRSTRLRSVRRQQLGGRKKMRQQSGGRKRRRRRRHSYKSSRRRKPKHLIIHTNSIDNF